MMPKLSGKVVVERLLSERPDLPIIFISGYAHDVLGEGLRATDAFLQKPFSAHDLSVAVRVSLDRSQVLSEGNGTLGLGTPFVKSVTISTRQDAF
jgi:two-component system cell cycle sensor histidine kinase/response regulator CckA